MKALSLTQPWASLVALQEKQIETRSWATTYRGPIAIHASKGFPTWAKVLCQADKVFRDALRRHGISHWQQLPLGAVIATANLEWCRQIDEQWPSLLRGDISLQELDLGDYTHGRYAWGLWGFSNVKLLRYPIPARGSLGLWEWTP